MSEYNEIHFHHIYKFFQKRCLLNNVSLSLKGSTAILLSGENGAGKTTLLRILAGLEKPTYNMPTSCMVQFGAHGKSVEWKKCRRQLQQEVMYLHQQPYMFNGNVVRNLKLALPAGIPTVQLDRRICESLEWAQLTDLTETHAKRLSSGEKQRLSLARAWLRQSKILLLDEPIANMDRESRLRTVSLLKQLKKSHTALLIASHNHELFTDIVDHYTLLEHSDLISTEVISTEVISTEERNFQTVTLC